MRAVNIEGAIMKQGGSFLLNPVEEGEIFTRESLTEEQIAFQNATTDFFENEVAPKNSEIENHQNNISAEYLSENFSTTFNFSEEAGILGDSNVISNVTKLIDFKDYHNLSFSTRRNRKINLTEYYDIIYEYKNDCLVAEIKYRKDYYSDNDLIPKEELFFAITIVPFYTFSPDKMILQKDGGKKKQ